MEYHADPRNIDVEFLGQCANHARAPQSFAIVQLLISPAHALDLSRREFDLLHYLALHAGQVVTRRDLLTHVWRMPYGGADKTVDVHVSWLRRKLGETAQHPRYLHTVRGVGIKLSPPS